MRIKYLLLLLIALVSCSKDDASNPSSAIETRTFSMGFTAFPYDNSVAAQQETYQNVIADGDIFLSHLDHGVPWNEALNDLPFPEEVQNTLDATKTGLNPNTKIVLTATPNDQTRENLAMYWNNDGTHQPLPVAWQDKTFDDPDVVTAYVNYCRRIINEVQPDYFAYGIETNATFQKDDTAFAQFLTLADTVYAILKADYPNLPIFLTVQDQSFNNSRAELLETTSMLLEYSDYIAISTYPFLFYGDVTRDANPDLFADDWLLEFRNLDVSKPMAISETGFCAEDMVIENLGINVKGTEEWQTGYMDKLFEHANNLEAEFVLWFVYRDYDMLYDNTPNPPDIFKIWRDNGLLDGQGNKRPAHIKWLEWKALKRE
ncbi:hypothetical protein [Allomuricauda sp. d1]|uniref:hypothetical protein n=1 Tax=Allomuricauda sp. d1 TaxID=3136725 RepID=UPI0031DBD4F8